MTQYIVRTVMTQYLCAEIEADSESQAIEIAAQDENINWKTFKTSSDIIDCAELIKGETE